MGKPTGKCIVFSSPSGAGKTTIVRHLLDTKDHGLEFSISATNREMRNGEKEGRDYYFLSTEEFRERIEQDAFVEWEEVYENRYYGTLREEVERIWAKGKHVIFDVDVKGALSLKREFGERAVSVFVQPPSMEALEERLRSRGTESGEVLQERLERAKEEMRYAPMFDVVILNDDLNIALQKAEKVVTDFLKGT